MMYYSFNDKKIILRIYALVDDQLHIFETQKEKKRIKTYTEINVEMENTY